jgi:hypothetical protein
MEKAHGLEPTRLTKMIKLNHTPPQFFFSTTRPPITSKMATKQLYDSAGTTNFQFTFIDKSALQRRNYKEWHVFFAQGFISINDISRNMRIKVNFPEEDHWVYEVREPEWRHGGMCHGAEIKTKDFTLTVDVRTYKDSDDPEFDPEMDMEGENEGYLELDTKIGYVSIMIPYALALILIKFVGGSTALKGICGVHKSTN